MKKSFLIFVVLAMGSASYAQVVRPWEWQKSSCSDCGLKIETDHEQLKSKKSQRFLQTIETYKSEVIALYGSDPQEYNLLAHMAVGILGRESKFFTSKRYVVKQSAPWAVSKLKSLKSIIETDYVPTSNSSGPTQIKIVPKKIAEKYGVTSKTLKWPEHAAVATMGFLIEALQELKQKAAKNSLEFITPETYTDYLPYIYFGRSRALINRTADPSKNSYVKEMKSYMSWVKLFELDPK